MRRKLELAVLIFILIGALFVRVYRIDATQTFLEDEGRDLLIVQRMLDTKLPILLGPQTSTGNMYLGPIYYYFITPALILSGGNPVGPAIMIALTGVLTVFLLYHFAKRWFGVLSGLSAASLYAFLPYPVMFTRGSWNPNLAPLIMLLLLYFASRIDLGTKKLNWAPVFIYGLLAGALMQLHYMALVGVGATGVYIILKNYKHFSRLLSALCIGFVGMVICLSPFIVFEIRNSFVNSHAFFGFMTGETEDNLRYNISFSQYFYRIKSTFQSLVAGQFGSSAFHPETQKTTLSTMFLVLLIILTLKFKSLTSPARLLLITLVASIMVLGFYQEFIHLHYLGFLLPVAYLLLASGVRFARLRYLYLAFALGVILYNAPTTVSYITSAPTNQTTKAKEIAEYIVNKSGGRAYNVVMRRSAQTSPFQYYLAQSATRPKNDLQETLFVICDGSPCNQDDETTTLLYLTGPSHPALKDYLGHPELNEFRGERGMVSNDLVNYGIWVAELRVSKE